MATVKLALAKVEAQLAEQRCSATPCETMSTPWLGVLELARDLNSVMLPAVRLAPAVAAVAAVADAVEQHLEEAPRA